MNEGLILYVERPDWLQTATRLHSQGVSFTCALLQLVNKFDFIKLQQVCDNHAFCNLSFADCHMTDFELLQAM